MTTALAVSAALVALVLAMSLTERWLRDRRGHEATWAISLGLFVLGAAALAWGSATGWSTASFRAFYLFGAIVNVPFLAAGQLEFLARPHGVLRWGRHARSATALLAAFAAGVMATTPFIAPVPSDRLPRGSEVLGVLPRALAAACSGVSAAIVFVGAAFATIQLRANGRRRRALGTALVALGTAVLSSSGLLNSALGEMRAFSVTLTAGVVVLFAGFVLASADHASNHASKRVSNDGAASPTSTLGESPFR